MAYNEPSSFVLFGCFDQSCNISILLERPAAGEKKLAAALALTKTEPPVSVAVQVVDDQRIEGSTDCHVLYGSFLVWVPEFQTGVFNRDIAKEPAGKVQCQGLSFIVIFQRGISDECHGETAHFSYKSFTGFFSLSRLPGKKIIIPDTKGHILPQWVKGIDFFFQEISGLPLQSWLFPAISLEELHHLIANHYQFTVSERTANNLKEAMEQGNNVTSFLKSEVYFSVLQVQGVSLRIFTRRMCDGVGIIWRSHWQLQPLFIG